MFYDKKIYDFIKNMLFFWYNFHVHKNLKKDNRETKQWLDNHVKCVKSIIIAIQVPFHSGHLLIKLRSSQVDDDWKYWSNWITSNVNDVLTLLIFYLWPAHIKAFILCSILSSWNQTPSGCDLCKIILQKQNDKLMNSNDIFFMN